MKVVVVMPFDVAFNRVFASIQEAVTALNPSWRCVRIDKDHAAGDVLTKIQHHIKTATICIADVTHFNPNVMWEIGYASALQKPIIAIGQSTASLPFDIYHLTVHEYSEGNQQALKEQLTQAIAETQRWLVAGIDRHIIAVAWSHTADRTKARRAFESLASPYLGRGITWYCGARDPMQQEVLGYLLDQYERITVINRQDRVIESTLLARLKRHEVMILDPQNELATRRRSSSPDLLEGFDASFTLYANRAEYVFLLWDGKSVKTREFYEWLAANGRSCLLTHV